MYTYNKPTSKHFRKQLRTSLTSAEAFLWQNLQKKQLGRKFRRQYSIGKYIVDFYCAEERLVIELDGQSHENIIAIQYDEERTKYIESLDIKVLRFENKEVMNSLEFVLERIKQEFK